MNELQKKEFDLLCCFIEICDKLNLNYFLVCGSALGAARHNGFIPWDDDLDVGMYREDYNKFMELAPKFLPEGVFLQNYKTDSKYPHIFSKLRNSNTTYIEKAFSHINMNHGIFIDIFPLDGYPSESVEQKKVKLMERIFLNIHSTAFVLNPQATFKSKMAYNFLKAIGAHKRFGSLNRILELFKSKYSIEKSDLIRDLGTDHKCEFIPKVYFGKGTDTMFEGIKVRVPENLDGYLTSLYGDWRTPPPPEKQKGHHLYDICDTEKPYTYYLKK